MTVIGDYFNGKSFDWKTFQSDLEDSLMESTRNLDISAKGDITHITYNNSVRSTGVEKAAFYLYYDSEITFDGKNMFFTIPYATMLTQQFSFQVGFSKQDLKDKMGSLLKTGWDMIENQVDNNGTILFGDDGLYFNLPRLSLGVPLSAIADTIISRVSDVINDLHDRSLATQDALWMR